VGIEGKFEKSNDGRLNCADLFAGAGGFSLAARRAGLEVRLAVEHARHAVATYKNNLCKAEASPLVHAGDIRVMDPKAARENAFGENEPCDLLLGGPPCQGFSTHRLNGSGIADERNDLIHVYFKFVRAFAPSVFLMENVPGMLWDRHASTLNRFYLEGALAGYDVQEPVVIDARDFGVAQRRKRVFILGLKRGLDLGDLAWPPKPTHGSPARCAKDPTLRPWRNCAHVFAPAREGDINNVHMKHGRALLEAFQKTPLNGGSRFDSGRLLACHAAHDGHKDVYGRIDPSQPAPTMTTACINPSKGRFVHPTRHHGITAREAARIQTFPDDFVFSGGLMAAGVQIGNAVPVDLGEHLIRHLEPLLWRGRGLVPLIVEIRDRSEARESQTA
jgi:DNA (cytosine-5)-methyltransferase 1